MRRRLPPGTGGRGRGEREPPFRVMAGAAMGPSRDTAPAGLTTIGAEERTVPPPLIVSVPVVVEPPMVMPRETPRMEDAPSTVTTPEPSPWPAICSALE